MMKNYPKTDYLTPNQKLYGLPLTVSKFNGMPFRPFGNTGLKVSNIGLGTWKFGYPQTGDGARVNEKTAFEIFDNSIENGVTFWDTANRYNQSSGNSERVIGKWFAKNPNQRRNVVLATKIYGLMDGLTPNHCRLSRVNIMEATYACLERLRTDRIEIMQLHFFDDLTPPEESLMAVEDLISQDIVRYLGVSNFSVKQIEKFVYLSNSFRKAQIQSVQNQFDILYGEDPSRKGVLDYCFKNRISFIPWSPFRGGLLTERYLDKTKVGVGDRLVDEKRVNQELKGSVLKKLLKLRELAQKWNMTIAQLNLAYLLHLPGMGPIIPGCSTPEQLKKNAKAGKIALDTEQIKTIQKILQ